MQSKGYFRKKVLGMSGFVGRRVSPVLVGSVTMRFMHHFTSAGVGGIVAVRTDNVTPTVVMNCLLRLPIIFTGGGGPIAVRGVLAADMCSFAGSHSCSMYIDGSFLSGKSHILFVSSFLTGNGTTGNVVSLMRGTKTRLSKVKFVVRGTFRRNKSCLHGTNVHMRSLTVVRDLSGYRVGVEWPRTKVSGHPVRCQASLQVRQPPPYAENRFYYRATFTYCFYDRRRSTSCRH